MSMPGYRDHIIRSLPATRQELHKNFTVSTTQRWLKILHDAGEIHIGGWLRAEKHGAKQPIWHAGPGEDAKCLKSYTMKQSKCKYVKRIKEEGIYEIRLAKHRAQYAADKAQKSKTKNTWLSALL